MAAHDPSIFMFHYVSTYPRQQGASVESNIGPIFGRRIGGLTHVYIKISNSWDSENIYDHMGADTTQHQLHALWPIRVKNVPPCPHLLCQVDIWCVAGYILVSR